MNGLYTRSPTPHTRPLDAATTVDDPDDGNPGEDKDDPDKDKDDPMRFVRLTVESPAETPVEASAETSVEGNDGIDGIDGIGGMVVPLCTHTDSPPSDGFVSISVPSHRGHFRPTAPTAPTAPMAPTTGALGPDEDADDEEAKGDIDGA